MAEGSGGMSGLTARAYVFFASRVRAVRDLYAQAAEDAASLAPGGEVLDVGSGPGLLEVELASRPEGLRVVGLDVSETMVKIAERRLGKTGLSERVRFVLGDAGNLPVGLGSFDLVLSTLALHHFPDPAGSLLEMCRVLKPGGTVLVYDIRKDITREVRDEFRRRYGRVVAFGLGFVTRHAELTIDEAKQLTSSIGNCSTATVEETGIYLRIRMRR